VALICPLFRAPRHLVTWRMFDRARTIFFEHMREGFRARMGARAAAVEPAVLETMMDVAIDRAGPLGFLATFEQYTASSDLVLGNVEAATLLVAGGTDPTFVPEAARTLAGGIPGARLRITDDYDHFCHVRHARGVAAQIADFAGSAVASTPTVEGLR
jgi:pimeloyl-ACP methyl ester carboxylesterase